MRSTTPMQDRQPIFQTCHEGQFKETKWNAAINNDRQGFVFKVVSALMKKTYSAERCSRMISKQSLPVTSLRRTISTTSFGSNV